MRPLRLDLEGFLSYRGPTTVDLAGERAVAIVGENGAGKTSLVEAIGWALFGKGRGRGPDDFVASGSTQARVGFTFDLEGAVYRVERQRDLSGRGTSSLVLEAAGEPVGGDSISETQLAIERLLGMGFDTWAASSYIAQGKADAFTTLKPAARKDLLAEVLDLRRYAGWAQTARDQARALENEIRDLEGRIAAYADWRAPSAEDLAGLEKALKDAHEAFEVADATLEGLRASAQALRELEGVQRDLAAIAADVAAAEDERAAAEIAGGMLDAHREHVAALEANLADDLLEQRALEDRVADLRAEIEAANALTIDLTKREAALLRRIQTIEAATEAVCPTCERDMDEALAAKILADLRAERAKIQGQIAAQGANADDARRAAAGVEQRLKVQQGQVAERRAAIARVEGEIARARVAADRGPALAERVEALRARVAEARSRAEALEGALVAGQTALEVQGRIREVEVERQGAQAALRESERQLAKARASAQAAQEARERADEARKAQEALRGDQGRAEWLARAFGRDGIPALLIDAAVPELEAEADRLTKQLTAGRFSVRIESQRVTKAGDVRESLEVLVADDVADRPLEALSGGERQAVDLALRVGLARLLARRAGRRIQTLIIDEGFTALDTAHRQRTIEAIHGLTAEFDQILFVTHLQDLADAFPARIEIVRGPGGSELRGASA